MEINKNQWKGKFTSMELSVSKSLFIRLVYNEQTREIAIRDSFIQNRYAVNGTLDEIRLKPFLIEKDQEVI
jgi:hypothetical protein